MEPQMIWKKREHIRIMTFNRPQAMNSITLDMMKLEGQYLLEFQEDDDAWVLIYTGTGSSFCTGLDLKAIREIVTASRLPRTLTSADPLEIWKPIIAAINGYALGGGCERALACDIRIAAEGAQLGLPEVKRALIPGGGGPQRLPRIAPLGNALMMLFTGDWINAREAHRIGLVQQVVPDDELMVEAVQLAERICENAPIALKCIKEAVYRGLEMPLREALAANQLFFSHNRQMATEDINEGIQAFAEKRKPTYKGR